MIRVQRDSFFSRKFTVYVGDSVVAWLDLRDPSFLTTTVEDARYTFHGKGFWNAAFILEDSEHRLVCAKRNRFSSTLYAFDFDDEHYVVKVRWFGRYDLLSLNRVIGSLYSPPFGRTMTASLPEQLPIVVRVFIVWLVLSYERTRMYFIG